jgi:transposase
MEGNGPKPLLYQYGYSWFAGNPLPDSGRNLPQSTPNGLQSADKKRGLGHLIGQTKGGMSTKLHAATDANERTIRFFMTAGQVSDYTGVRALVNSLPAYWLLAACCWLLADRGYDADWFREALVGRKIIPCIPGRKSPDKPVKYEKRRYRKRNRIKIMFGRLKDWRRGETRYDGSPKGFLSAIAFAATVIFWLCVESLGCCLIGHFDHRPD